MRTFTFDLSEGTPDVSGVLCGPAGSRRITMVFDIVAVLTQSSAPTLTTLGYGPSQQIREAAMVGAGGERHEGILFKSAKIVTL